mgnify:FL=1
MTVTNQRDKAISTETVNDHAWQLKKNDERIQNNCNKKILPASMSLGDRVLALFNHSSTLTAKLTSITQV